jgi:hypothetical protein
MANDPAELILNRTWRPQLASWVRRDCPRRQMRKRAAAIDHAETLAALAADI